MISEAKLRAAISGNLAGMSPTVVAAMEARAIGFVETATNRCFGPVEELTEFLPGRGTYLLALGDRAWVPDSENVISVTERATPGAAETALDASAFELRQTRRGSLLARIDLGLWTLGYEYAVTYRRGYDRDQGPPEIEQLVIDLIALRVNFLDKAGMRAETIGGYSYTRFGEGDLDSIDGAREVIAAWRGPVWS